MKILDEIKLTLGYDSNLLNVYINVYDNSLSKKWLAALNHLIKNRYHLEKNYCWFGWANGPRNGEYLCDQINHSIACINSANIGYYIDDRFTMDNTMGAGSVGDGQPGRKLIHNKFNQLHRYFEDLQGVSGRMSEYYTRADARTRWHIRQINLLCHEFESWALSWRKSAYAPFWMRPSQLMCWLHAPRFTLDEEDLELFGIETLNRHLGGVYVGVNKAVGKHHWEVYNDEGRDSRVGELTTSTLRSQTEAAGDFDIEWANDPGSYPWQIKQLKEFREWLQINGFDPEDKSLTIGHPQVGQVDLQRSFGTEDHKIIWNNLESNLNVAGIETSQARAEYVYNWSDADYAEQQIAIIQGY